MDREVLTIQVSITQCIEVKGHEGRASMILFGGSCDCAEFKGRICEGGVDTQKQVNGRALSLSARYILEGIDREGASCRIFIENEGVQNEDGSIITKPLIYTDSPCLSYLESADLYGTISPAPDGVVIHIMIR